MPESIDWPPTHPTRHRRRRFLVLLVLFAGIFFGGRTALSYYVDMLWFRSLGYGSVFSRTLSLQSGIFAAFAAVTFLILYGSFLALKRAHLPDLPSGHTIFIGGRPLKLPVEPVLRFGALGISLVIAAATGASMMVEWPTLALFWYAARTTGDLIDPIFGKQLNFFLFALPALAAHCWLAADAGRDYLLACRFLHLHHRRNSCARRPSQPLRHVTVARTFHHVCVSVADPRDASVYRPVRVVAR
jgi:hypothetical protein